MWAPLPPRTSDGSVQDELCATYRHHAFITNSTLTTCEVIAFNLARAAAVAADLATIRWASLRTKTINIAGRIATIGRRLDLHLPDG